MLLSVASSGSFVGGFTRGEVRGYLQKVRLGGDKGMAGAGDDAVLQVEEGILHKLKDACLIAAARRVGRDRHLQSTLQCIKSTGIKL